MNTIWAPWRAEYIVGAKPEGCIFCDAYKTDDKLLITQGATCLAIMNRFPYTSGHCMIAPKRHLGDVTALSAEESAEMDRLMKALVTAIRKIMNPDGFNIGMNIGRSRRRHRRSSTPPYRATLERRYQFSAGHLRGPPGIAAP